MGGGLIARTLLAIALLTASSLDAAQAKGYDELSAAQRRLLQVWGAGVPSPPARDRQIRDRFDAAPERFRIVFAQLTARLAAVLLSDPENGEVLGAALDLVDAVEPPERQPSQSDSSDDTLSVFLASGARDRLRRSAEFERVIDRELQDRLVFEHAGPPALRLAIGPSGSTGQVSMPRR